MIGRFASALVLLTVAVASPAAASPHPAVCRVAVQERGGEAYGSGTLIDARGEYGLVVTNWHVVRDATGKIETRFPGGFVSEARPLKLDETWDLAALVIWRPPVGPAPLAERAPAPGERLTICGYGSGDYLAQTGRCTDYYSPEVGQPQELVELNVQARQGDSGGPIFNDRGELAGVLFGAARGTTLGSFGGRVQTFLATLAPDIGAPNRRPALLANQAKPREPRPQPAVSAPAPARAAVDPFQVAERRTPPPSLADRSAAVSPAKRPQRADDGWFAPVGEPSARPFSPQVAATPAAAALPPTPGDTVDWSQDGQTLLAVLGVAALFVSAMRLAG